MTYILSVIGRMKYIIFDMSVITRALEEKKQGSVIKKQTVLGVVASVREA